MCSRYYGRELKTHVSQRITEKNETMIECGTLDIKKRLSDNVLTQPDELAVLLNWTSEGKREVVTRSDNARYTSK